MNEQIPADVSAGISSRDFALDSNKKIYRAMQELDKNSSPITLSSLAVLLADRGELESVGAGYLAELTDGQPRLSELSHYVAVIKDKSARRQYVSAAELISASAMDVNVKIADLAAHITQLLPKPTVTAAPLQTISYEDLLARDIKPRENLLEPIIPEQGLAMLFAKRGDGKTYLGLGIAVAVAGGGQFLKWKAPRSRRVLYIDGELPLKTLQERMAMIVGGSDVSVPAPGMLHFLTPDLQESAIPDLSTVSGQMAIEPMLEGVDFVVVDNLSALCRSGKENEGESWLPVQAWALELRRRGISVLFIHHAGKSGQQRGSSRREDLLDTVLSMRRPADYCPTQGLRAEIHIEKGRGIHGEAAAPFEVTLSTGTDGVAVWMMKDLVDVKFSQASELFTQGVSVRMVAEELGIPRSTAGRLRQKWDVERDSKASVPLSQPPTVGRWDSSTRSNGHAA
jgi:hypothetical protein